ncbi:MULTISPECIES: 5-formyltetrahydrofolate cyclo-ligase [Eubacterium]|uniref:5-formyltetrahydrofolate cyclo-ligase n=1 Tax=Eubacterium barkeri TaxID=1528 RepID=A0A1H3EHQ5_EUBBA|nr:5-formyltetrahydrofolate cyclo-ligase [Eubacterium barkeri]SDX77469.1 5-formyltetrahydrofolate cyclo-ligase [Eubacterium barkeri]
MDKQTFRKETLAKRKAIYSPVTDARIVNRFLASDDYKSCQWIMVYVSFGTEINTHELIRRALTDGKHVVAPICVMADHTMILSEIQDFPGDLEEGHYGILEVKKECIRPIDARKLDLVLVPGMAFMPDGGRMGFGGGYYDRFLETITPDCKTLGLIREDFIYETIPMDAHDKHAQVLVTEDRIINCQ